MPSFRQIFEDSVEQFRMGPGVYAGVGSMSIWDGVFRDMKGRLGSSNATVAQVADFQRAVREGINRTVTHELKDEEKQALRDTLDSAFDGMPRSVSTTLAPKAQFLRNVELPESA